MPLKYKDKTIHVKRDYLTTAVSDREQSLSPGVLKMRNCTGSSN